MTRTMLGSAAMMLAAVAVAPAAAQTAGLFQRVAGVWSGTGSVSMNGGREPMRCRASYAPSGDARLHLDIACATDSFKLAVASDLARDGERVSGSWREATYGVSGSVSGTVRGDRLEAVVAGLGLTARLSLALRGASQNVTLASDSQIAGTANVVLRRR